MGDISLDERLFQLASAHHGYFTAAQAAGQGVDRRRLSYHAQRGRLHRVRQGLYRLRDYPDSAYEEIVAAWLALDPAVALASHESALDLLGLSDVIPAAVHLTVPRRHRHLPALPGTTIHTTTRFPGADEITVRHGIRLTSPMRTIIDSAEAGTAPEQIVRAIVEATQRGLVEPNRLQEAANGRGRRVGAVIAEGLRQAAAAV